MAIQVLQVCDFGQDHPAELLSEVRVGDTVLSFDVCHSHTPDLLRQLQGIGYQASHTRVGKDTRGAYFAKSGTPFTSNDVRIWLQTQQGRSDIPATGRLPQADLDAYAAEH